MEAAKCYVELAGGADKMIDNAQKAFDKGDYRQRHDQYRRQYGQIQGTDRMHGQVQWELQHHRTLTLPLSLLMKPLS